MGKDCRRVRRRRRRGRRRRRRKEEGGREKEIEKNEGVSGDGISEDFVGIFRLV